MTCKDTTSVNIKLKLLKTSEGHFIRITDSNGKQIWLNRQEAETLRNLIGVAAGEIHSREVSDEFDERYRGFKMEGSIGGRLKGVQPNIEEIP